MLNKISLNYIKVGEVARVEEMAERVGEVAEATEPSQEGEQQWLQPTLT